MSEKYIGEGSAFIVHNKCNKVKNFTSSYKWAFPEPGDFSNFSIINYENSIIGKKNLSAVIDDNFDYWSEVSSNGLLNFNTKYYYDEDLDAYFITVIATGVYKKCNYSSYELDYLVLQDSSVSVRDALKNKSANSEEFHKLLESKSHYKKIYNKIKEKLSK
jgi:hypothetical protein